MSIGRGTVAAGAAMAVAVGDSVSILMVSVQLAGSVAVAVGLSRIRGVASDGQIALHVVLGRGVRAVRFAEQTVVRVLTGDGAAWRFRSISGLLSLRSGKNAGLHSVLVHAAWSLGFSTVSSEKIAASTAWRLQDFARVLGVFSESNVEAGGSHLAGLERLAGSSDL